MGRHEDEHLCDKYDTLDALYIKEGELGRGLFLRKDIIPGETLLILHPSSLLHVGNANRFVPQELIPSTINPSHENHWSYKEELGKASELPCVPLTSVQLLTLILALWKAKERQKETTNTTNGEEQEHEKYLDTFLGTYPTSFPSLPLSWQLVAEQVLLDREVRKPNKTDDCQILPQSFFQTLLSNLPNPIHLHVEKVLHRFKKDVRAIKSVQNGGRSDLIKKCINGSSFSKITNLDWIWSWSCVNSRCLFLPLGLKPHEDNFTLAPLLDMANHTMENEKESKVTWLPNKALQLNAPKSSSDKGKQKDEEIFISYGPHSNGYLFAEYGFTIPGILSDNLLHWIGNPFAEINVDHHIDQVLSGQGREGKAKIELLKEFDYFGEYTIHPHPKPAHPSYRLLLAAKLIVLDLGHNFATVNKSSNDSELIVKDPKVCAWIQVVQGFQEKVDDENEKEMHSLLSGICNSIQKQSRESIEAVEEALTKIKLYKADSENLEIQGMNTKDLIDSAKSVIAIHNEESHIARMLQHCIDIGHTDW